MKELLTQMLNEWKNGDSNIVFPDALYTEFTESYFLSEDNKETYKSFIIERIESMLRVLEHTKEDFINETRLMWKEISETGCEKSELDPKKYPLSRDEYIESGFSDAVCIYAYGVDRIASMCESCPLTFKNKTCVQLYFDISFADNIEERKKYAKEFLEVLEG